MKRHRQIWAISLGLLATALALPAQQLRYVQLPTPDGILEGVVSADGKVRTFKGIPYAAPPVGPLRWKPPQPVLPWVGVRKATEYAPRAMQGSIYSDMVFHDAGPSEDCLYLNLWMPASPPSDRIPVMVWIHGGGQVAGSSSEPRQDAGNLSKKGVMIVSLNYRLGVFGFLAHPELAKESGHGSSGNYGLMDQIAALEWVKKNISIFGGDPDNVTVFGESSGAESVSALIASPLAKGLFKRAIAESGTLFDANPPLQTLAEAEAAGIKYAESAFGTDSLASLRDLSAQALLDAALKLPHEYFAVDIDGYLLPADCKTLYADGRQSHVPLMAGWNGDEGSYTKFFAGSEPTVANYRARARTLFGANADAFLMVYRASTDEEARRAAQDLESDLDPGYPTWKWLETHHATSLSPVYRYKFLHTLPLPADADPNAEPSAPHASEIEFVFQVLSSKKLPWRPEDQAMSELMSSYWTNFAKTGDPNGPGLPNWPAYTVRTGFQVMNLSSFSGAGPDGYRGRYVFLDKLHPAKGKP